MITTGRSVATLSIILLALCARVYGAELLIGAASGDITPDQPVPLCGQFHLRISRSVETPIAASVLVFESRDGDRSLDQAVMVACDVVYVPVDVLELVRREVSSRVSDLDTQKIFISGTHTHTAPELRLGKWVLPKEGVMTVEQYQIFFAQRVADAIAQAWKARAAGSVSWGLGHAVVAYNRRAVYANGTARMYGATNVPEFRSLEGYEDHDVPVLFAWNLDGELIGMAVNVACPAQEVESRSNINADFWHPVREAIHKKYGAQVCVLGWTGAGGDISPHLMYRQAAEQRMLRLRGLSRLEEIARRLVRAVDDAYEAVKDDRHTDIPLIHQVKTVRLPMRLVTEAEYREAKSAFDAAAAQIESNPRATDRAYRRMKWYEVTVDRFEMQKTDPKPTLDMELHVVRIGDAVVCTNQFELFTDYGIRMKARSKAVQTFIIQLVGPGTYLPTEKAVRGGHYSAIVHSSLVGPEGGQVLVDRTVELIDSIFAGHGE
jgi:hypothetical protein